MGGRKSAQLGVTSPNKPPVRDVVLHSNFKAEGCGEIGRVSEASSCRFENLKIF